MSARINVDEPLALLFGVQFLLSDSEIGKPVATAITKIDRRLLCINTMRRRFTKANIIFLNRRTCWTRHHVGLTTSTIGRCSNSHARKPRTHYLDGLLPERPYRAFSLWGPSLFHHLSVLEKPEARAGAGRLF